LGVGLILGNDQERLALESRLVTPSWYLREIFAHAMLAHIKEATEVTLARMEASHITRAR
jgi:hypothetical protein